jgi:type I restriction enzyme M protein
VEAIIILPRNMFYTTDISVTLWVISKNKKSRIVLHEDVTRNFRNREEEILFMDLRQRGEPFEKKFVQFSEQDIKEFANTLHTWQQVNAREEYKDVAEYCYSANKKEIATKDYSLVPRDYIEYINRDENIDFDEKMNDLKGEFGQLLKQEEQSKNKLLNVFKELGYEIKL